MNEVLIANILMVIGEGILFVASSRKSKKQILLFQIASMVIMAVASYLLKGYGAIVMDVIGITRNVLSISNIASRYLTYLFISHDLSVVKHMSDKVGVMYVGKLVETAPAKEMFANPRHPYSKALLSSKPVPDPRHPRKRQRIMGEVANPANPPSGCYFHPRCPYAKEICGKEAPPARMVSPDHMVLCHFDIDY